jgi:RinA family phage transcriptional activator
MVGKTVWIDGCEVGRHYVDFIEAELKLYPTRKVRLRTLEEGIIRGTPTEDLTGMPRGGGPSNPTHNRAMALMNDQERTHLALWIRAIEEILKQITTDQQHIIRHMYFENRLKPEGVADLLNMTVPTLYRYRNRALLRFCLGMIGEHVVINVRKTGGSKAV